MPTRETLSLDYADIIEDSLNEIYIFDANTLKFILVNKGARQNIGYSMQELGGLTPIDIKPNHSKASFQEVLKPLIENTQEKIQFRTIHQRKDGSRYPVEVHLQKRELANHPVYVAIILDISEREKIQSDLSLAHAILESAPDAMVVVDSSGKIQLANKQMSNLFGYSYDELLTMSVDDFVPLQYRGKHPKHREAFEKTPRMRGMGSNLDLSGVTKRGIEIPIEVSLSPIPSSSGQLEGLVAAAIRDITARKAFEQALHDSEENQRAAREIAEKATRTKTRFLAAASHDLRQPLQALRLYLSALGTKLEDEKALKLSAKMHLSLDTMGDLLEALLDLSSLESGTIQVEKRDVSLLEIIDRLIAASEPQATAKGLELTAAVEDVIVHTDPALLQRIIENFIANAIRYTQSGEISIHTEALNDVIKLSVTDTGLGIPQNELVSVFEEYYQVEGGIRDRSKGLGLGLSIVKHLARILEYAIAAESEEGQGSTFSVEIPLGNQGQTVADHQHINIQKINNRIPHVLIIDDEPDVVDAMSAVMEGYNIKVSTAQNGNQALDLIDQGFRPDFIVSDYRMPEMTGVETVQKVREKLGLTIPVVIMTGDTSDKRIDSTDLIDCIVLTKPINVAELMELITNIKD